MAYWASLIQLLAFLGIQEILCDNEGGDVHELRTDVEALQLQVDSLRALYGADIQLMKRNLRRETAHRSNLEEKVDRMKNTSGCSQEASKCTDATSEITTLQKAFEDEKKKNTEIKSELVQLQKKNAVLTSELDKLQSEVRVLETSTVSETDFESVVSNITIRQDTCQKDVINMKENVEILACSIDATLKKETKRFKNYAPSFVSDWIMMESMDDQKSSATIHHGFGNIPRKVDIQVRPVTGANEGWLFPGSGATQIDDDFNTAYGGVIYTYDHDTILIAAPKKSNGAPIGTTIDTGRDSYWLGENHQRSSVAYVRARAWGEGDLPDPDFTSPWTDISVKSSTNSYLDIEHRLGVYPDLVTVQIKLGDSGYISDGIGSSMFCAWPGPKCYQHNLWGGVIYGFSDTTVRIWVPYVNYSPHPGNLGFGGDGWGFSNGPKTGQVRVFAWILPSSEFYRTETIKASKTESVIYFSRPLDVNKDYVSVYAEASEGANNGYRFKSWGGAQNPPNRAAFGGLISAYSAAGGVRIWRPDVNHRGSLINIKAPYGRNESLQVSNEGHIVATVFKPKCIP